MARSKGIWVATAESCTGGLIASTLTNVSGSSDVFACGFITYANEAKKHMLGVTPEDLTQYGAVSEPVARAMSEGAALQLYEIMHDDNKTYLTISATGIAGPKGGNEEKPVGTVHIACSILTPAQPISTQHEHHFFKGERNEIRTQTVNAALNLMMQQIVNL